MNAARWRRTPVAHRAMLVGAHDGDVRRRVERRARARTSRRPAYPQADKHRPSTLGGPGRADVGGRPRERRSRSRGVLMRRSRPAAGPDRPVGRGPVVRRPAASTGARDAQPHPDHQSGLRLRLPHGPLHGAGAEDEVPLPPRRRHQLERVVRVPDGVGRRRSRSRSSTTATPRTTSRSTGRASCAEPFKEAPDTKLFLHAGDLIDSSTSDSQWGEWFNAGRVGQRHGAVLRDHRQPRVLAGRRSRRSGTATFAWPQNGPAGHAARSMTRSRAPRSTRLPGRAVHLAELQRRGRWPRPCAPSSSTSRPRGSRACSRTTRTSGPSWTSPPPDVLQRARAQQPGAAQPLAADPREVRGRLGAPGPRPLLRARQRRSRLDDAGRHGTMYVVSVSGPKMYGADDSNWVENGARVVRKLTNTQLYQVISRRRGPLDLQGQDGDRPPARPVHDRQAGPDKGQDRHRRPRQREAGRAWSALGAGTLCSSSRAAPSLARSRRASRKDYEAGVARDDHEHGGRRHALDRRHRRDRAGQAGQRHVRARLSRIQAAVSGAFGPVGGSPLALHSYSGPVSEGPAVTIRFKQSIGGAEPLRTGAYARRSR